MLFKQGRSIKSVLATSNIGLSLIPALIDLVGLTLEDFLDFYFTRGLVLKIDLEAISGANVASTYMGISEHLAAVQHGQSSSSTNQRKVFKHHARCLDVLDGTDQPDRTVTIRPSSFLGRYTNIDGSEWFPDPTAAGANPAAILRSAMLRLALHTKHERGPDPSASQFFPTIQSRHQLRVTQLTLSHLRRNAIWFLRSWLPHHIDHDILELIVILRYPHIDMRKLQLKANIHVWNLSNL
jgi:hypothetical protein